MSTPAQAHPELEKIRHLNSILQALRDINQLIMREKNPARLLQKTCEILVAKEGFRSAWIALTDAQGQVTHISQKSFKRHFSQFSKRLKQGQTLNCLQRAAAENKVIAIPQTVTECGDCPLKGEYGKNGALSVPLLHEEKRYGFLTVAVDQAFVDSEEDHLLLQEMAGDLALALFLIENEQKRVAAAQTLERRNELLAALIEAPADIIIFSLDKNYCYTAFNANHQSEMRKVYGVDIQRGMNMLEIINIPEVRQKAKTSFDRALAGERFSETEEQPGLGIFYEFHWGAVRAQNGEVVGLTAFIRNITEKKQLELKLREQEKRFRALFDFSPDAVFVHAFKEKGFGKFIEVNRTACERYGYTREEFLQLTPADITLNEIAKKFSTPQIKKQLNETGQLFFQIEHITKDGRQFPAEISSIVFDFDGKKAILSIARDISERKELAQALQESEQLYRNLLEVAPVGIAVHSEGKIVFANPAALRLIGADSMEQVKGMPITKIIHPDILPQTMQRIKRMLAEGEKSVSGEDIFVSLDGSSVEVEVMATPLTYHGRPAVQVIFTDITERKKNARALREKMNELERFNRLTVGRELKMIELKKEINALLKEMGQRAKYKIPK